MTKRLLLRQRTALLDMWTMLGHPARPRLNVGRPPLVRKGRLYVGMGSRRARCKPSWKFDYCQRM